VRPDVTLDGAALRANAAAFAALGAPVAAVVKGDGYGWGARLLARELDAVVESYVVADEDELAALRPATEKPIRLLLDAAPGRLPRVLALRGIPNVSTRNALAEAIAAAQPRGTLTVRVGVLDAVGWASIPPRDAPAFAQAMAGTGLSVELWTHVVSTDRSGAILNGFTAARLAFEDAGSLSTGCVSGSACSARGSGPRSRAAARSGSRRRSCEPSRVGRPAGPVTATRGCCPTSRSPCYVPVTVTDFRRISRMVSIFSR
jgi:alanine racemase